MAKELNATMRFDVAPDVVFAAQSDARYVTWKHQNMASFDVRADVRHSGTGTVISSTRKLPAVVPAAARRFVGDAIEISEVHSWSNPARDGSRTGTIAATFPGVPMTVHGTLSLRPDGYGAVLRVAITAKSPVPLVGSKLEEIAGEQFLRAIRKEQEIAPRWFSE